MTEMNRENIMKQDLENAKKLLLERQERIKWYVEHEIDSGMFENNVCQELFHTTELKKKIEVLELYLQMK